MTTKKIKTIELNTKHLIAACPAGLGNRIKCIVATMKKSQDKLSVYWPINEACGCKFNDLFQPTIKMVSNIEGYDVNKSCVMINRSCVIINRSCVMINRSWKFVDELDFKYHQSTKKQRDKFLPYFKFIKPKQDIEDTVWAFMNKYKESFERGEVIGVHIRKGDYKVSFDGRQYISDDEKFIRRMDKLLNVNPDYKFLICTEDEFTEHKFEELFGKNHIIYFPKKYRGRNTPNSIKEALVDMLLLSKCPIILGTFLSTFTEVAWWLGECKAQVVIPGTEDKEAVAKVWAQLPKEGEGIHKKIWRRFKILWKEGK